MQINTQIFRGYDIRGIVDKDLNVEIVEHLGRAYGTYISKKGAKSVVVGCDSRESGPAYKEALIKGLTSTGLNVIDVGLVMVGMIYWAQYYFKTIGASMVTASHNPKEYNGFKFTNGFSEAMTFAELKEIEKIANEENYKIADRPGEVKKENITQNYFDDLKKKFKIEKKFKVVIDACAATAGAIVPKLLKQIGCEVVEQNCRIDSSFPVGIADPTELAVAQRLADGVIKHKADIGFAYDADGDRIGIVDENGRIVWNDVLVAIFSTDVLVHHPGAIIMYNTLCSKVVEDAINGSGGKPFMWRTGHGFLKKKNQEVKAAFIGELSGHFFFSADFYNHDDGCYATLRLLDYLSTTKQTLSQAIDSLPQYFSSPEIKLFCAEDKKMDLIKKISPVLEKDFPDAEVIDDERAGDGVRLNLKDGMFVIRYSQNGPYITIKFEGKTKERYDNLKKYLNNLLHSFSEIDWNNKIKVNAESLN